MASLAAAAAKRRLPTLMSLYGRVRSSSCSSERRGRESEGIYLATKINGAPPEDLEKRVSHRLIHVPPGYVIPAPCVSETKCYDSSPKPKLKHDSFVRYYTSQTLNATVNPNPDIFIHSRDKDDHTYFTAYSVDEEDGSMSPKYYIYPPSPIKENWVFLGATCNGLFHFLNGRMEHVLWNPTTNELKTLPTSCVDRPLLDNLQVASGMWSSDHRHRQTYKLLQLVWTYTLDEEGNYFDRRYCIWLYKLKSNSWKKIPCTQVSLISSPTYACINGVFYSAASLKVPYGARAILSFDFSAETLSTLPLPPITSELFYRILEYKGLLSLVVYSCREDVPTKYELWVRNMNDGLWSKESVFHVCGVQHPIWFSKNGQLLYFESFDYEVVVFDRAVGKSKNLGIYAHSRPLKFYPFVESVVQLNDVEEEEEEEEEDDDDGYTIEAEDEPSMPA